MKISEDKWDKAKSIRQRAKLSFILKTFTHCFPGPLITADDVEKQLEKNVSSAICQNNKNAEASSFRHREKTGDKQFGETGNATQIENRQRFSVFAFEIWKEVTKEAKIHDSPREEIRDVSYGFNCSGCTVPLCPFFIQLVCVYFWKLPYRRPLPTHLRGDFRWFPSPGFWGFVGYNTEDCRQNNSRRSNGLWNTNSRLLQFFMDCSFHRLPWQQRNESSLITNDDTIQKKQRSYSFQRVTF